MELRKISHKLFFSACWYTSLLRLLGGDLAKGGREEAASFPATSSPLAGYLLGRSEGMYSTCTLVNTSGSTVKRMRRLLRQTRSVPVPRSSEPPLQDAAGLTCRLPPDDKAMSPLRCAVLLQPTLYRRSGIYPPYHSTQAAFFYLKRATNGNSCRSLNAGILGFFLSKLGLVTDCN